MADRLKIIKMVMPAEFVLFDYNPEAIKVSRQQSGGGRPRGSASDGGGMPVGGTTGSLGAIFHGTDPLTMTITKAHLVGPECKVMCDNLMNWLSPASGLLGAITAALGLPASRPPDLIVQWGPPVAGLTLTAQMTRVDITYVRVSEEGIPLHAVCTLVLKESPSPLSLTNPTSGGRPGRNRHVVHADETLMSIAVQTFGNPNAWRAIAEVNRIDDPHSLQPGDVIYLPARDELRRLAEASR